MKIILMNNGSPYWVQDKFTGTFTIDTFTKPYEPINTKVLFSILEKFKKPIFLDIGAGIGAFSLPVAAKSIPIIAIEPCKKNFSALTENFKINYFKSEILLLYAIATPNSFKSKVNITDKTRWEIWRGDIYSDVKVSPWPIIENICKKKDGTTPIIKMDIEGAEWPLLTSREFRSIAKLNFVLFLSPHIGFQRELRKSKFFGITRFRLKVIGEILTILYLSIIFTNAHEVDTSGNLTPINFFRRKIFTASGWPNNLVFSQFK